MTFWENTLSTFIGAVLGFIFAIVLFYLTNIWSRKLHKKSFDKNLAKECEFNEYYLEKIVRELQKVIEKIGVNDKNVFHYFNYVSYKRLYTQGYFQQGFLYEKLGPEEINLLDTILTKMTQIGDQYINNSIQLWKEDRINQKQIFEIVSFERNTIEKFIGDIGRIKQKITGKVGH